MAGTSSRYQFRSLACEQALPGAGGKFEITMSMIRKKARAWGKAPKELASVIVARLLVSYGEPPDNAQHRKNENNDR